MLSVAISRENAPKLKAFILSLSVPVQSTEYYDKILVWIDDKTDAKKVHKINEFILTLDE